MITADDGISAYQSASSLVMIRGVISRPGRSLGRDPVATTEVLAALRELRPSVPVTELPELGHYPQIEDPSQIARALRGVLST